MYSGPSRAAEAVVAFLLPPACREEVVGDLHERFKSPFQYARDALFTVPLVILSRVRRIENPQILLIQAFTLYLSFLGAARLGDGVVLREQWGLLRIAIPPALVLLGLILDDTYASPGRRSPLHPARGPTLGCVSALASEGLLWISNSALALPRFTLFYGCAIGLLLTSAMRMLFPPIPQQLLGVNERALRLKQERGSRGDLQGVIQKGTKNTEKRIGLMSSKRRIAITCALLACVAGFFFMATTRQRPLTTYTYSQFLDQVHSGQVASVVVIGSNSGAVNATFRLKDGKAARTVLPSEYKDALRAMQEKLVNIEIRGSSSEPHRLLINASPFLLLLAMWILALIWKFPNGFRRTRLG